MTGFCGKLQIFHNSDRPAKHGFEICFASFWNSSLTICVVAQICRRLQTSLSRSGRRLLIYSMFTSENYLNCRKLSRCRSRIRLEIFTPVVNGNVANCGSGQQFVCCSSGINHFRGCHLCPPLLSCTRLPPPDMSTLVKSWPYRELYGLIGAPLRWDRARHVFVVEQREACVEVTARSPSIWSGILFLGGSGHPVPPHTPPAKQQPKEAASCRRSIVGFREWAADSR